MPVMKKQIRDVPGGPPALGPYSLGVVAEGRFVFVSGMTPWDLTLENFKEMNGVYARYFAESAPARATIGAQLLGFDVEIECVANLLD